MPMKARQIQTRMPPLILRLQIGRRRQMVEQTRQSKHDHGKQRRRVRAQQRVKVALEVVVGREPV